MSKLAAAPIRSRIKQLVNSQHLAVLSTAGKEQPYISIIGFITSRDLQYFYFSTPRTTRKYKLLKNCKKVALQVDSRSEHPKRFMDIESVTATGICREMKPGPQHKKITRQLIKSHPYLRSLYESPTCALIEVKVTRYFHVHQFQQVSQWIPKPDSTTNLDLGPSS